MSDTSSPRSRVGPLEFRNDYPTPETVDRLRKELKFQAPKDVPANDFWSVAVYDTATRSLIDNGSRTRL